VGGRLLHASLQAMAKFFARGGPHGIGPGTASTCHSASRLSCRWNGCIGPETDGRATRTIRAMSVIGQCRPRVAIGCSAIIGAVVTSSHSFSPCARILLGPAAAACTNSASALPFTLQQPAARPHGRCSPSRDLVLLLVFNPQGPFREFTYRRARRRDDSSRRQTSW
jgi:hypothetical protein